ncbi:MAG: hypothetical protein R2701_06540 [Acidimicrobiales bacterium]
MGVAVAVVAEGGLAPSPGQASGARRRGDDEVATGKTDLEEAPFIVWIPVAAVCFTAASLNYLGDAIRDHFDVRESAL